MNAGEISSNRNLSINPIVSAIENPTSNKVLTVCQEGIFHLNEELGVEKILISFNTNLTVGLPCNPILRNIKAIKITDTLSNDPFLEVFFTVLGQIHLMTAQHITYLDFSPYFEEDPDDVLKNTPNLSSIKLSFCPVDKINKMGAILESLGRNCPKLSAIELPETKITTEFISQLKRCCPNLKDINFSKCTDFITDHLLQVVQSFPNLNSINLPVIRRNQISHLDILDMWKFFEKEQKDLANDKNTDPFLPLAQLNHLTTIDQEPFGVNAIDHEPFGLNAIDFMELLKKHNDWKKIHLSSTQKLPVKDLVALFTKFTKLQSVNFGRLPLTNTDLKIIQENCTQLKSVRMFEINGITDEGLSYLSGCKDLSNLELEDMQNISDLSIRTIVKNCNLISIFLNGCEKIKDTFTNELFKKGVKKIHFSAMENFLENHTQICLTLEDVFLDNHSKTISNDIRRLSLLCPNIRNLSISSHKLINRDVNLMTLNLNKLITLYLFSEKIKSECFTYFSRVKTLRIIDISNCGGAELNNVDKIAQFRRENPHIKLTTFPYRIRGAHLSQSGMPPLQQ